MFSFGLLMVSAVLLAVNSRHAWRNPRSFFVIYETFIVTIFVSQMPFLYILNRLVNHSLHKKSETKVEKQPPEVEVLSGNEN
jgi:hypothetical protein